jgi:hypothetical protein
MIDAITPGVDVYWRGKTYRLQLTLGALAGASRLLGVPILEGGPGSLDTLPEFAQRAIILFALVHRKFRDATIAECEEAVFDPTHFVPYAESLTKAMQDLAPAIEAIKKETAGMVSPQAKADQDPNGSGDGSGPSE